MCNECCKEFHGWCRAFTSLEVLLSIVQAALLTLFVAFLTFLILHFIACSHSGTNIIQLDELPVEKLEPADGVTITKPTVSHSELEQVSSYNLPNDNGTVSSPVPSDIACTWTSSAKTEVVTQYFVLADVPINTSNNSAVPPETLPLYDEFQHTTKDSDGLFGASQFDGEPADIEKSFIMALVKMRPPHEVTFGCILTVISQFWTLTAASCIESIEEVDYLDSFVIMENFEESRHGRTHPVSDVLVHPRYQGSNKTYDIAALKSENELSDGSTSIQLPTMLDYLLMAIGERLIVLGFGKFRSMDRDAFSRVVHAVSVSVLPSAQCAARGEEWGARHLGGGARAARGGCGRAALCAGPLHARGLPCNYCAGTPLLQARTLLGLMSGPGPCGAPCEPALYVNLAASRDWLDSIVDDH